jgi:hypothetical protein
MKRLFSRGNLPDPGEAIVVILTGLSVAAVASVLLGLI